MAEELKMDFSFSEFEDKLNPKPFYTLFFVNVIMSLFSIQALRSYVPGVYVAMFHVVFGDDIIENLFVLLTMVFFVLPALTNTISKKIKKRSIAIFSIYIIAILRLLIALHLPNIWQTIFSGLIVSFYGVFISTFITLWIKDESDDINSNNKIKLIIISIFCAFLLDYLIRTIGFSQDISLLPPGLIAEYWFITQYIWLLIQIALTVICIYLTRLYFPRFSPSNDEKSSKEKLSTIYSLLFAGNGLFWFLLFNIFFYPNIIAHYTGTNYYFNNISSILSLIITILIILRVRKQYFSNIKLVGILNGVMILSLCLFLFIGRFLSYFASIFISIALIIMYLNYYLLFERLATINFKWEKVKTISNGIAISFVFYILFTVLHIFTSDWAYVISAFKGYGPFIVLLAGIIFSILTCISVKIKSNKEVN